MGRKLMLILAFVLAMSFVTAGAHGTSAQASNEPLELAFDKSLDLEKTIANDGVPVWSGVVSGDITGSLETRLIDLRVSDGIWHVEFDWIIVADDPAQSFTARLNGILNTGTGAVVMNGTVTEGFLLGAQVHEEGQLIDPATLQFQGLIRLMPATAS